MSPGPARCWRAFLEHDARFDGAFVVAVRTTGIFCRPVCPARRPKRENCAFFAKAAEAARAGYRPCLRCRPEEAPGRAPADATARLAAAAAARIGETDGTLEQVARGLGVSGRHLRRVVRTRLGTTPVALRGAHRLSRARRLLRDPALTVTQVAHASGFGSVRRFNEAFRAQFGRPPRAFRSREGRKA